MSSTGTEKEAIVLEILQIQNRLADLYRQIKRASQSNSALAEEAAMLQRHLASLVDAPEAQEGRAGPQEGKDTR